MRRLFKCFILTLFVLFYGNGLAWAETAYIHNGKYIDCTVEDDCKKFMAEKEGYEIGCKRMRFRTKGKDDTDLLYTFWKQGNKKDKIERAPLCTYIPKNECNNIAACTELYKERCKNNACACVDSKCIKIAEGSECSHTDHCGDKETSPLYCNGTTKKCEKKKADGAPCKYLNECQSNLCAKENVLDDQGTCQPRNVAAGGKCKDSLQCTNGWCIKGTCYTYCQTGTKISKDCACDTSGGYQVCGSGMYCAYSGQVKNPSMNTYADTNSCIDEKTFNDRINQDCLKYQKYSEFKRNEGNKCVLRGSPLKTNCSCSGTACMAGNYCANTSYSYANPTYKCMSQDQVSEYLETCVGYCTPGRFLGENETCYCGSPTNICKGGQKCEGGECKWADCSTIEGPDGQELEYQLLQGDGKPICISHGGEYVGGSFDGCKAMPHRLFESRKCFLCPLFKVVFEAMDTVSYKSMIVLNKSFMAISAMMMALYIAIVVLGYVSQVTKQEAPKFINAIIKQSAKFVIAFLLLMNYTQVYHWVVVPLLDGGLELAGHISSDVEVSLGTDENVSSVRPKILGYHTSKGVSSIVFDRIQSFLRKVQNRLGFMQSVGGGLLCASSSTFGTLSASMFMPAFEMLFLGLIVSGFSLLLSFAFAFYLIDAVVQLGVLGALMPLLILSWPFKVTSKYTKKGMEWLINIFVVFSMMALLVNINFALVDHALAQGKTPEGNGCVKEYHKFSKEDWAARVVSAADLWIKSYLNIWFNAKLDYWKVHPSCNIPLLDGGAAAVMDDDTVMCMPLSEVNKLPKCGDESSYKTGGSVETLDISSGMKKSALAGMYDAIHLNQLSKLKQMVNITGTGFLILIIGCWFGFKLIGKVSEIASKFAGGAVSGIGSSMATMAGSLSKGMVTGAAAPILAGAGKTVSRALETGTKNFAVGAVQLPFKAAHYGGSLLTGGNYAKGINQNLANKFNNIVGTVSKVSQNVMPALKNSNVQTVAATSAIAFAASGANINAATPPVPTKAQVMNLLTKEGDNVEENGDLSVITHKDGTQSEVSKDGGVNFSSGVTEFNKDGETHYVNSAGKRISKEEADNLEKIAAKRSRDFAETTQSELPPEFPKPPVVNAEQNSNVQSAKINNNQEKHKQNAAQSRANNNQQKQSDAKKPRSDFEKLQAKTAFEKAKAEFEKNKKIADNRQKKHLELMKENGDVVNTRNKDGIIYNKVDDSMALQKNALKETVIKHQDGSYSVITSGGDGHSFSGGHSHVDENGNKKFYNLEGKEITAEEYRAMNENVDKRNKYFADEYNKAHANDSMNEEKRQSKFNYSQEREVLSNYLRDKGLNTKENIQRLEDEAKNASIS